MGEQTLSVGDVARRSGIAVSALHFYETRGLIVSTRTAGNQRRYRRDTLRRLALIQAAQRVGVPLRTIADALQTLPASRTPTRADWTRLSARWRDDLARLRHARRIGDNPRASSLRLRRRQPRLPPTHLEGAGSRRDRSHGG